MKSVLMAALVVSLGVAACHHTVKEDRSVSLTDYSAMERFAIDAVYEARPTRALVDKVETVSVNGSLTVLRVEMTGAPTARQIYHVTVSDQGDNTFGLEAFETIQ